MSQEINNISIYYIKPYKLKGERGGVKIFDDKIVAINSIEDYTFVIENLKEASIKPGLFGKKFILKEGRKQVKFRLASYSMDKRKSFIKEFENIAI